MVAEQEPEEWPPTRRLTCGHDRMKNCAFGEIAREIKCEKVDVLVNQCWIKRIAIMKKWKGRPALT